MRTLIKSRQRWKKKSNSKRKLMIRLPNSWKCKILFSLLKSPNLLIYQPQSLINPLFLTINQLMQYQLLQKQSLLSFLRQLKPRVRLRSRLCKERKPPANSRLRPKIRLQVDFKFQINTFLKSIQKTHLESPLNLPWISWLWQAWAEKRVSWSRTSLRVPLKPNSTNKASIRPARRLHSPPRAILIWRKTPILKSCTTIWSKTSRNSLRWSRSAIRSTSIRLCHLKASKK